MKRHGIHGKVARRKHLLSSTWTNQRPSGSPFSGQMIPPLNYLATITGAMFAEKSTLNEEKNFLPTAKDGDGNVKG